MIEDILIVIGADADINRFEKKLLIIIKEHHTAKMRDAFNLLIEHFQVLFLY